MGYSSTKKKQEVKTCKDLRKVASISDSSKIFETFLRDLITEDINQFAGKKGTGTEHMIVLIVDRILWLLDQPGSSGVISAAVDWADSSQEQNQP